MWWSRLRLRPVRLCQLLQKSNPEFRYLLRNQFAGGMHNPRALATASAATLAATTLTPALAAAAIAAALTTTAIAATVAASAATRSFECEHEPVHDRPWWREQSCHAVFQSIELLGRWHLLAHPNQWGEPVVGSGARRHVQCQRHPLPTPHLWSLSNLLLTTLHRRS